MKKIVVSILLISLFILLPAINYSGAADLTGMCPLPYTYNMYIGDKEIPNQFPALFRKLYVNAYTTYGNDNPPVPDSLDEIKPEVLEEDQKYKFSFRAKSNGGSPILINSIRTGQTGDNDPTTAAAYVDWMPKMSLYHKKEFDICPLYFIANDANDANDGFDYKKSMSKYPSCYSFAADNVETNPKKSSLADSVKWDWQGPAKGWICKSVGFDYNMDSSTFFSLSYGNVGANPFERVMDNDFSKAKGIFPFAYYVPSVPAYYAATSVITMRWDWPYKYSHQWIIHHVGDIDPVDGFCDGCKLPSNKSITRTKYDVEDEQGPLTTPKIYWTHEKQKFRLCRTEIDNNDGKCTLDWPASNFYSRTYLGASKIENPGVADARIGKPEAATGFDKYGLPPIFNIYGSSDHPYSDLDNPALVARALFYVKDSGNIAHVQTGIDGSPDGNLIKAECGEPISAVTDSDITFFIVDNNPWANKFAIDLIKQNSGQKYAKCEEGKWLEERFKVNFWYEIPLYQYVSILSDMTPIGGGSAQSFDSVYSPVFVWKKYQWSSLGDFLDSSKDGSKTVSNFIGADVGEDGKIKSYYNTNDIPSNPVFVIYEKKIPISKLFIDQNTGTEEVVPLHYAKTSLGDSFGNPPYGANQKNTLLDTEINDASGASINSKFKVSPIKYIKGKGPLKYFVEVQDGSLLTNGGGQAETSFDCSDSYFKQDFHKQGAIKINPDIVKFIPMSANAPEISEGAAVDPTAQLSPCLSVDYDPEIQSNWKTVLSGGAARCLNKNVDPDKQNIIKNFQAWGRIEIDDTKKPNLGLRILNAVTGKIRYVFKINDLNRFKSLFKKTEDWSPYSETVKFNYPMYEKNNLICNKAPYTNEEDLWLFDDVKLLVNNNPGPDKIIYEGRDIIGEGDSIEDSLDPYGTTEDTPIHFTHQDLRDDGKKVTFFEVFAHDNIDGQRVIKNGNIVKKEDWYKGVTSYDFNSSKEITPVFSEDLIGKGYTSWKIIDETFTNYINNQGFITFYKSGGSYRYPLITFNNPNCNSDGTKLNEKELEISVMYGVADQAGNFRKLKLKIYVMPVNNKINVIERKN